MENVVGRTDGGGPGEPPGTSPRKPLVLCVDDNPCVLAALRRVFRAEPYGVVTAVSAAQALGILRHDRVCVLISDLQMPDVSGPELLWEVEQRWPWIGRVILTAYPERAAETQGLGVDLLLHSPWNDAFLRQSVRQLLRRDEGGAPEESKEHPIEDRSRTTGPSFLSGSERRQSWTSFRESR